MDIYRSVFFKCMECNFKFSLLGAQAKFEPEVCPCCQGDINYMSKSDRENYINELKDELNYM